MWSASIEDPRSEILRRILRRRMSVKIAHVSSRTFTSKITLCYRWLVRVAGSCLKFIRFRWAWNNSINSKPRSLRDRHSFDSASLIKISFLSFIKCFNVNILVIRHRYWYRLLMQNCSSCIMGVIYFNTVNNLYLYIFINYIY